ncbi:hypothetical protein PCE1_001493 [Barthelona sp. PCE]
MGTFTDSDLEAELLRSGHASPTVSSMENDNKEPYAENMSAKSKDIELISIAVDEDVQKDFEEGSSSSDEELNHSFETVFYSSLKTVTSVSDNISMKDFLAVTLRICNCYFAIASALLMLASVLNFILLPSYSLLYYLNNSTGMYFVVANGISLFIIVCAAPQLFVACISFASKFFLAGDVSHLYNLAFLRWFFAINERILGLKPKTFRRKDTFMQIAVFFDALIVGAVFWIQTGFASYTSSFLFAVFLITTIMCICYVAQHVIIAYVTIPSINDIVVCFHLTENKELVQETLNRKSFIYRWMMNETEKGMQSKWARFPCWVCFLFLLPFLFVLFMCPIYVFVDVWEVRKATRTTRRFSGLRFYLAMFVACVYIIAVVYLFGVAIFLHAKFSSIIVSLMSLFPSTPFVVAFLADKQKYLRRASRLWLFVVLLLAALMLFFIVKYVNQDDSRYPELGNAVEKTTQLQNITFNDFQTWYESKPYIDMVGHQLPRSGVFDPAVSGSLQSAYPICSMNVHGLSVFDYMFFSFIAYRPGFYRIYEPFKNDDWEIVGVNTKRFNSYFIDFYSPSRNLSVVAIRGTSANSMLDFVLDFDVFSESALLGFLNAMFPFGSWLPESFQSRLVSAMSVVEGINDLNAQRYDREAVKYIKYRSYVADNTIVTGHSLGGGLAQVVAAKTGNKAIVFSSPGMALTSSKFKVPYNSLRMTSTTVVPDNDPVAKIDIHAGEVQRIACDKAKHQFECHGILRTFRELGVHCINSDILYLRDQATDIIARLKQEEKKRG